MKLFWTALQWEGLKWLESFKISLSKNLNYKVNFALTMIIPVIVFFAIKYNLWHSIYDINPQEEIQGYSLSEMIEYQFWILIFDLFVRAHFFSQNISIDIRMGKISSFLLYPFHFISYQLSLFLSNKLIQSFIGAFSLILAVVGGGLDLPSPGLLFQGLLFIIMASVFWFWMQLIIGFLAFWLEETWSLNVSLRFIAAFFSGAIIPLDLYPQLLTDILLWTPFPHLIYIPVRILMGEAIPLGFPFLILSIWLILLSFLAQWIWRKGLKLYTGAGI